MTAKDEVKRPAREKNSLLDLQDFLSGLLADGRIKQEDLAWHDHLLEKKLAATNAFQDHHATGVVLVNAFDHDVFTGGVPIWDP